MNYLVALIFSVGFAASAFAEQTYSMRLADGDDIASIKFVKYSTSIQMFTSLICKLK